MLNVEEAKNWGKKMHTKQIELTGNVSILHDEAVAGRHVSIVSCALRFGEKKNVVAIKSTKPNDLSHTKRTSHVMPCVNVNTHLAQKWWFTAYRTIQRC